MAASSMPAILHFVRIRTTRCCWPVERWPGWRLKDIA
jgi:hypothetical protein